jgi:predicted regulator of Ras-like GTPase activity (Roadblock/LC7/MglB family)
MGDDGAIGGGDPDGGAGGGTGGGGGGGDGGGGGTGGGTGGGRGGKGVPLRTLLRQLRGQSGVVASTVISRDGLPLASDLPTGMDPDTLALRGAFMQGIGELVMESVEQESERTVVVVAEQHYIVTTPVDERSILVVVVDRTVDIGGLLPEVRGVAMAVRGSISFDRVEGDGPASPM